MCYRFIRETFIHNRLANQVFSSMNTTRSGIGVTVSYNAKDCAFFGFLHYPRFGRFFQKFSFVFLHILCLLMLFLKIKHRISQRGALTCFVFVLCVSALRVGRRSSHPPNVQSYAKKLQLPKAHHCGLVVAKRVELFPTRSKRVVRYRYTKQQFFVERDGFEPSFRLLSSRVFDHCHYRPIVRGLSPRCFYSLT